MVVPDYYARYPKPCAGGWGRVAINVSPTGKALPCHAAEFDSGPRILERARSFARRHLALKPRLQGVPRHGLDARTLPFVRPARDRLGRMPLSGVGPHRRRAQHRSGLPQVAASRMHRGDGDGGIRVRRRRAALAIVQERQGRGLTSGEIRLDSRRHREFGAGLGPTAMNETGSAFCRNSAVGLCRRRQEVGFSRMHRAAQTGRPHPLQREGCAEATR